MDNRDVGTSPTAGKHWDDAHERHLAHDGQVQAVLTEVVTRDEAIAALAAVSSAAEGS